MLNIKLVIAYDGTTFFGWQKTVSGASVESVLEKALIQILQHPVKLQAASRTDRGVHAHGQVVNFLTPKEHVKLCQLKRSLNQLLSPLIAVLDILAESTDFHPTLDCKQKEYHYFICLGDTQMPQHRFYSWHCPRLLYQKEMLEAAQIFVGQKDFSAFCNFRKQQNYKDYIRDIDAIEIENLAEDRQVFKIRGRHFLYKMVRNIVGTLVYVGMGKLNKEDIPKILAGQDRTQAGMTAPAHGLFLHKIHY